MVFSVCLAALFVYVLMFATEQSVDQEYWDFSVEALDPQAVLHSVIVQGVPSAALFVPEADDQTNQNKAATAEEPDDSVESDSETDQTDTTEPAVVFEPLVLYRPDGTYYRSSTGAQYKMTSAVGYWDYLNPPNDQYPIPNGRLLHDPVIRPGGGMVAYCTTTIPSAGGCTWYVYSAALGREYAVTVTGGTSTQLENVAWDGDVLVANYLYSDEQTAPAQSLDAQAPWQMRIEN